MLPLKLIRIQMARLDPSLPRKLQWKPLSRVRVKVVTSHSASRSTRVPRALGCKDGAVHHVLQ